MKVIDQIYINGAFVTPHGTDIQPLFNPATGEQTATLRLGDETDTQNAIASAKAAFRTYATSSKEERTGYLQQLHDAVFKRKEELTRIMMEEYGAPHSFAAMSTQNALNAFTSHIQLLKTFDFVRIAGHSTVRLEPVGVAGIITPWNASNSFICNKLSAALAAGCTTVIKPSEMSGQQTQLLLECFHEAGLPAGLFNVVNGKGDVVGAAITSHPDIAKISFTGSTLVGKTIARGAIDTLKRVTLELGGKSPNILLDDAILDEAVPRALTAAYMNSGQACIAGTRLLVPEEKLEEVKTRLQSAVAAIKVGMPQEPGTHIGPMVSPKQYERVQQYIRLGIEEGAELLAGGEGKPEGLESGNFVKPTIFVNVNNQMRIAREEIFGPVLSVIAYKNEEEAIAIANDTEYGLQAYISSSDKERALRVASRIAAGRVSINELTHDPMAPFGGFKQSGIGREFGAYGLEAYLEPKTLLQA